MVVGRELWVGTGKGVVVICSVSEAVAEKEAAIAKLLQSSSEAAVSQQPGPAGQGLLTPELDRSSEDTQSSKEMEDSPLRTRRTAFGRTLRVPQTRLPSKKAPAVFRLQFKSSHKIVQAESVRVLLSVRCVFLSCVALLLTPSLPPSLSPSLSLSLARWSGGSAVVSCVNSAGEWGKGVQGWTCKTDEVMISITARAMLLATFPPTVDIPAPCYGDCWRRHRHQRAEWLSRRRKGA